MREHKPTVHAQTDYLRKLGYESEDVNPAGLVKWLSALFAFLLVMSIAALGIYWLFVPAPLPTTPETALKVPEQILPEPPNPLLQGFPRRDIADYRQMENAQLDTFGWVDKQKGIVRIPIEDALDMTAKAGLPSMPGAKPLPIDPATDAGYSDSPNPSYLNPQAEPIPSSPASAPVAASNVSPPIRDLENPNPPPVREEHPKVNPNAIKGGPIAPTNVVPLPAAAEPNLAPNPLKPAVASPSRPVTRPVGAAKPAPAPTAGAKPGATKPKTPEIAPPPPPTGANPGGPFGNPGQGGK